MEIPEIKFNTENTEAEIKKILNMNKTDFADYYSNLMKDSIKIIGKEHDVYHYNNVTKLWQCNTKEVYEVFITRYLNMMGKALMKAFLKVRKEIGGTDESVDENLSKMCKSINGLIKDFDSNTYIRAIIDRSTGQLQDNQFATKLNSNPDYLAILNGMKVNLKTGEVTGRTKSDYFSYESKVDVVKVTEQADKFFSQVMPNVENREYLRKVLGYMLTGNMDARVFFIWYGDGSNGKSVIMKLLKCILGPLYHQCSKGIFMKGSQEKVEGPSPDKVALIGVRCATYSEGETADEININESFLKMVSGKDEINARALFKAPLTFFPICKMSLLTNYKPDMNGDKSIRQRLRYLFLDSSFVENPNKNNKNEFKTDEEFVDSLCEKYLSQVFSWILKGSIEYYQTKSIIPPKEFQERTELVFNTQDSISSFLERKIKITNNDADYKKKGELFEIYKDFCSKNSQRCHPRSTLFKRLDDLHIRLTALHGYDVYRGIKIISIEKEEINEDDYNFGIEKKELAEPVQSQDELLKQIAELKKQLTHSIKVDYDYIDDYDDDVNISVTFDIFKRDKKNKQSNEEKQVESDEKPKKTKKSKEIKENFFDKILKKEPEKNNKPKLAQESEKINKPKLAQEPEKIKKPEFEKSECGEELTDFILREQAKFIELDRVRYEEREAVLKKIEGSDEKNKKIKLSKEEKKKLNNAESNKCCRDEIVDKVRKEFFEGKLFLD